jgi:hypothetical protein
MKNCTSKTVSSSCKDNMQTTGLTEFESTSSGTSKLAFYINRHAAFQLIAITLSM